MWFSSACEGRLSGVSSQPALMLILTSVVSLAAAATPSAQPLRSGCSSDDQQITLVSPSEQIQVDSAVSGEDATCYKITVIRGSQKLTGYVTGGGLPAIAQFERDLTKASREARAASTQAPPKAISHDPSKPTDPLVSTQFENFSAVDSKGKHIDLADLRGRAIVITFWSPHNPKSLGPLLGMDPLYNQLHASGLDVIGVSTSPNPGAISEALDDFNLHYPQVADPNGLAQRYNVDPSGGKTFVLDANHRIVAAGKMGPEIVKAVRQLMNSPEHP